VKIALQILLTLLLASAATILLLYQPLWMWTVALVILTASYIAVLKLAARALPGALIVAALAPLSYTAYIFYLLATVDAARPAEWPTFAAIGAHYAAGAIALGLIALLNRARP
jgi:hypothetical protein